MYTVKTIKEKFAKSSLSFNELSKLKGGGGYKIKKGGGIPPTGDN